MGNRFGSGVFLELGVEVAECEAEFLLDVGEDGEEGMLPISGGLLVSVLCFRSWDDLLS